MVLTSIKLLYWDENIPATLLKVINSLIMDLDGCEGYIDKVVI